MLPSAAQMMKLRSRALLLCIAACSKPAEQASDTKATEVSMPAHEVVQANAEPAPLRTIDKGDGCTLEIVTEGSGETLAIGDVVALTYEARAGDATEPFASTKGWSEPLRVRLGAQDETALIPGLTRALEGLKVGTHALIHVSPELAYGKAGRPSAGVPADTSLSFDVEVLGAR